MKRIVLLFILIIPFTNTFGQLGYRYGSSFIELYPDSSSLYFVQTKNTEQMRKMKASVKNDKKGTEIICDQAFYRCYMLKSIYMPDSVTEIGKEVFEDCFRLSDL